MVIAPVDAPVWWGGGFTEARQRATLPHQNQGDQWQKNTRRGGDTHMMSARIYVDQRDCRFELIASDV